MKKPLLPPCTENKIPSKKACSASFFVDLVTWLSEDLWDEIEDMMKASPLPD
jgi:hypothetical protein